MAKKILFAIIVFFIITGGIGLFWALNYRTQIRQARQTAKAPQVKITIIGGWSVQDIADYLNNQSGRDPARIVDQNTFLQTEKTFNISSYPLLDSKPAGQDLEGFLFPDTYFIPKTAATSGALSQIIINKTLENFSQKITPAMQAQASADELSLYQIVTLASIIEKEAGASLTDKKMISGIFYNRIKAGMPLQSDATVSFVTGRSPVSDADTQIGSFYNTYKYKGLPTGPICNPGLDAITAALYPTASDYLYFLTDPQTGQAVFAKTFEEHLQNKAKYLK